MTTLTHSYFAFVGMEVDHNLKLPCRVYSEGNAVYYEWNADAKLPLSRYLRTSDLPSIVGGNGNHNERQQRHWCDFVEESEVPRELHVCDYERTAQVSGYKIKTEPIFKSEVDPVDHTLTLEDGAVVTYRWFKWSEQPALVQLAKEFPDFYSPAELKRTQKVVEAMHAHWNDKTFLKHECPTLTGVEEALLVTPPHGMEYGYVPVAIGSEYPNGNGGCPINFVANNEHYEGKPAGMRW